MENGAINQPSVHYVLLLREIFAHIVPRSCQSSFYIYLIQMVQY